jgi:RecA-family ATPase
VLSGSDGAGKSMLALQMAVAVACGLPVAGGAIPAPEATGRVVIISGEDDIDHIHRRLRTLRAAIAAEPGACGREAVQRYDAGMDRLDLVALDGERMPLMRAGRQDDEPRECAEATDALVQACTGARLIIIDPLVMFHSIAEGDNGHMDHLARLLIRIARRIGGALLAVHHTGQDALLTARDDHQAGRGATAFASAARAVWVLRRLSQQERRAAEAERRNPLALRILRGPKVSRGPEQDGVLMEMGQDGVLFLASPLSSGGGRRLEGKRQWDAAAYAIASGRGPDACPF